MERRSVHHSPPSFTTDTADQPFRSHESARVHHRSLRTVTSLVTSHPRAAVSGGNPGPMPNCPEGQEHMPQDYARARFAERASTLTGTPWAARPEHC